MSKNIFHNSEVVYLDSVIEIQHTEVNESIPSGGELEELGDLEGFTGPTADDLRREAEIFRNDWENEKRQMEMDAQLRAEQIIADAEKQAAEILVEHRDIIESEKKETEEETAHAIEQAKAEAERILAEANAEMLTIRDEAQQKGYSEGLDKGYTVGQEEVNRLIERLHVIINKAIQQRTDLIEKSESQIIKLVISIARKVVQTISEKQRNIVIKNILLGLKKIKSVTDIIIRVNLIDLEMTTKHKKDFIERVEMIKNLSIMEDSSVDPGGVIIETDYGQIDARIRSQLREVEDAINEISPIVEK